MIDFSPMYNYGMFTDYNAAGEYGKGSAIFIHCLGPKPYTGGCVALPEEDMKYFLENSEATLKVCIMTF